MRYYLPDSRDTIDPTFDFDREARSPDRLTRDDLYCHEVLDRPCDGILISYAAIRGGVYSAPARRRLLRSGAREFFRAPDWMTFMGDPGAFSYVNETEPPVTCSDVAGFYGALGLDYGMSVDHIVPGYQDVDGLFGAPDAEAQRRYDLTLALARDFLAASKPYPFEPVGVVQGWSPASFARAARELQRMGYRYLALGGLVKLKTDQLLRVLAAVDSVRLPDTQLHLLGVTRPGNVSEYIARGVASIDSTSPLRRAWLDARSNYLVDGEWFAALRIPSSDSPRVKKRIESGEIKGDLLRQLEQTALDRMAAFDQGEPLSPTLDALLRYSDLHSPGKDRRADYQRTLEAKPWKRCRCQVCERLGHHVIVFRGAERNRSRGFHNVRQFYRGMLREVGEPDLVLVGCGSAKLKTPAPARDLYIGPLAKASWKLAEKYRSPVRILSALHGLLRPDQVTAPYDATVVGAPADVRRAWEEMVIEQVEAEVPRGGRVVALAGADYLGWVKRLDGIEVDLPLARLPMGKRLELAAGKQPKPDRPTRTGKPIAWDFFWTTFRSRLKGEAFEAYWSSRPAWSARLELPEDTPLHEAIQAAREAGLFGKGTSKTGVFEVQNDLGIYWAPEGFLNIGLARPNRVRFIAWDDAEKAESRGSDHIDDPGAGTPMSAAERVAA